MRGNRFLGDSEFDAFMHATLRVRRRLAITSGHFMPGDESSLLSGPVVSVFMRCCGCGIELRLPTAFVWWSSDTPLRSVACVCRVP
jgi:hypothetical protein